MSVNLIIECKNEKVANKLSSKLDGKKGKGVLSVTIQSAEDETPADLPMPKPAEIKKLLTEVKEVLGVEVLKDIYTTHDAEKLKDLEKDEWPTVFAEATSLLEAHAEKEAGKKDKKGKGKKDKPVKKGKDNVKTDLDEVKKLCAKVASTDSLEASREILKEFGHNTTRTLGKADQPTLNSIAAAMRKAL